MKQLVLPNYKIPYVGGLCEGFVEGTAGQATLPTITKQVTYGPFPTAAAKWAAKLNNHPKELPPKGFRVPVYFTLGNNPAGHTALQLEDGRVASSTQAGYHLTAFIHPSLQDLINVYSAANNSCTYLGWSEYIGKLKIIEGETMPTKQDVIDYFKTWEGRDPTAAELIGYTSKSWRYLTDKLLAAQKARYEKRLAEASTGFTPVAEVGGVPTLYSKNA